jgi:acetyl esterase
MPKAVETALLTQTRKALRAMLALPQSRAPGLGRVEELEIPGAAGPLKARYYEAANASAGPLFVYIHGGGFVCGDIDTHDSVCSYLAKSAQARLLSVSYRLAPETPFPGQLEDARAVCAWAFQNAARFGTSANQIVLCGDSAGAYLAASCAREINTQAPGAVPLQVLFYPLVHIEDSLWADEELRNFRFVGRLAALYIARSLGEPMPSLIGHDLTQSPTTIIAGGGPMDPVRADVRAYGEALSNAGVRVVEKKYPALMHGGLNFTAFSKTARDVLTGVGELARSELLGRQT